MKLTLFIFVLSISTIVARAQQPSKGDPSVVIDDNKTVDTTSANHIYVSVQKEPQFPGGINKFFQYILQNIRYPEEARKNGIEGRVFITLVVEKDGSLSNIHVVRGISKELDAEAVRVLKSCPKWNPGIQNEHPVRVEYTMPITFSLPK